MRMVPHEAAAVLLVDRPHPETLGLVGLVLIGDGDVCSVRPPDPTVVWTRHALTLDSSAVANMRTEVSTVGIQYVKLAVLVPVGDQFLSEVVERLDLAKRKVRGPTDLEPASWSPGKGLIHDLSTLHGLPRTTYSSKGFRTVPYKETVLHAVEGRPAPTGQGTAEVMHQPRPPAVVESQRTRTASEQALGLLHPAKTDRDVPTQGVTAPDQLAGVLGHLVPESWCDID